MIAALVRRDASIRYLGRWLFVGPALTLLMMGVLAAQSGYLGGPSRGGPGAPLLILLTLWLPSAVYVAVNAAERRCSRFDMELPISSRDLWTARTVALSIASLVILAVTAAIMWVVALPLHAWLGILPGFLQRNLLVLAAKVAPTLLVGVAMAQGVSPELERLPPGRRLFLVTSAAFVVLYLLVLALGALPLWVAAGPLAVAAALGWRTIRQLHGTILVKPYRSGWLDGHGDEAERESAPSTASDWIGQAAARNAASRLWALVSVIYRSTTKMPIAPIIGVPILVAAGFTMAGGFGSAQSGDDSIRFSMLFIISYALLSFSGLPPRRLYLLDAFPLSRRFIFGVIFLPYVLLLGLGYAGGRVVADRAEGGREIICYCEVDGRFALSVPLRYGQIALDGRAPQAVAPWGEAHEVWSRPIWEGASPSVHSLFSTARGSSRDFVAWQLSRAVKEIYGVELPWETISEQYLTEDDQGRVAPVGGALTLAADHPRWRVRPYAPVFPVMALFVCGLWFVALTAYLRTLRPRYTEKQIKGAFWTGMVVLMGLHISQFAALVTDRTSHWVLSGASMIAIRALTARVPGGWAGVWVLSSLALFGLYRAAERRFMMAESKPGDDMRVALIERPIGASTEDGAYSR